MMHATHLHLSDELLSELSDFLVEQIGLYFPRKRWADLERGLSAAAEQFEKPDPSRCARWLLSAPLSPDQIEVLSRHLTVGETYFFREKRSLDVFETQIIPGLLDTHRATGWPLRIWSAGCSTGEEPYSIAMLLDRIVPAPEHSAVSILATDINSTALRKARAGIYGEWSFRELPDWIRTRYFTQAKHAHYEIHPRIRSWVNFSYLNLVDDAYSSITNHTQAVDVIFCRNVLMYFTPEQARKVINQFHDALVEGGWLIVGAVETSQTQFDRYVSAGFPGAAIYRKCADSGLSVGYPLEPTPNLVNSPDEHPLTTFLITDEERIQKDEPPPDGVADLAQYEPPPVAKHSPVTDGVSESEGEALSRRALACANQGQLDEAVVWCDRAIAADKFNPAHLYLLATIQQERGQYDAAFEALTRAVYLNPDFILAHFALGNQCLQLGRRAEADRYFRNALTLLSRCPRDDLLPLSDGLTAGRLIEIITTLLPSISDRSG